MFKEMSRIAFGLLIFAFSFSNLFALPTEFTVQVYDKKSGKTVENLSLEDFVLIENGREQMIEKVELKTSPLSIVLIPMIGEGQYCDVSFFIIPNKPPKNDMTLIGRAFQNNLEMEDEFAIILPDKNSSQLRGFYSPNSWVSDDFAELRKISNLRQNTITEESTKYTDHGTETETESYSGVETIYLEKALDESLNYLETKSKEGNRQIIFFLRPFYNLTNLTPEKEEEFKQKIAKRGTIFNWIGDDKEVYPVGPFQFYRKLSEMTGGERQPCKLLKSKDADKINSAVSNMISHLRTRYVFNYTSNNLPALGNLRQIELKLSKKGAQKAKGKFEINFPNIVSVTKSDD